MLSAVARKVHKLGMNVFQFDYLGEGDSDGIHDDIKMISLFNSAKSVVRFAEEQGCSEIGLLGIGIGNIVAIYLSDLKIVSTIVLLFPNVNVISEKVLQERVELEENEICLDAIYKFLGSKVSHRLWEPITGSYDWIVSGAVSSKLLFELPEWNIFEQLSKSFKPTLVLAEDKKIVDDFFFNHLDNVSVIDPLEHDECTSEPFYWDKIVNQISCWLKKQLGSTTVCNGIIPKLLTQTSGGSRSYSSETCSFLCELDEQNILGILHLPPLTFKDKRPCVIYLPGLGGSRTDVYNCGPIIGNVLASKGFYVLRYDGRGSGVSDGEFWEITWSRQLEELISVIRQLTLITEIDMNQINLISFSAGAKLSCLAANRLPSVRNCVLWGPDLIDKTELIDKSNNRFFRHTSGKIVAQYLNVLLFGMDYFRDSRKYKFRKEFESCRKPMLIFFGVDDWNIICKKFIENTNLKQSEKKIIEVCGGHLFSYHSMQEVITLSAEWLTGRYPELRS